MKLIDSSLRRELLVDPITYSRTSMNVTVVQVFDYDHSMWTLARSL
jgi:hypothetical protein